MSRCDEAVTRIAYSATGTTAVGTERPSLDVRATVALGVKTDMGGQPRSVENDLRCVKTCAHEKCAELFSLLSRPDSRPPALLFFKMIEVETKFPFANSISEFSRSQDPKRTRRGTLSV
jgi:hypothetical protein